MKRKLPEEFLKSFGSERDIAQKLYDLETERMSIYVEWKIVYDIEKHKRLLNAGSYLGSMIIYSVTIFCDASVKPFSPLVFMFASYFTYRTIDFTFKSNILMRRMSKIQKVILKSIKDDRSNTIWIDIQAYLYQ